MSRRVTIAYLIGLGLLLLAPMFIYPILVMKVLCFALFACAFNLLLGYTGLLSFGHAVFLGSAAYVTGHALKVWELPTLLGLLAGTGAATLLGWVIGSLAIRRQGIYFAMVTLALAQMVFFFFLQAPFTGGEDGLQGVPRGSLFGLDLADDINLYYLVLAIFAGSFWLIQRTIHSPFGQILKAIRRTSHGPSRWAMTWRSTSCWPSCFRPGWPGSPGRPRPWCSSSPR
jgi:branched-chain amino acid transport system permease protein